MSYFFNFDKLFGDLERELQEDSKFISKRRWYQYREQNDKKVLMYDVSGVRDEDIKVSFDNDGYRGVITISGETDTELGTFKCLDRFHIPVNYMGSDSSYYIENGILYIEIVADKKNKFDLKRKEK